MKIRKRVLPAGWYPSTARDCEFDIRNFVNGYNPPDGKWIAGIAPHAGWYFSGRPAARVLKALATNNDPDITVVFGGHLPAGHPPIVYTEDAWETPFGNLTMDARFAKEIMAQTQAVAAPETFGDNTVEIQLPFVKWFFPKSRLIAAHSPASMSSESFAKTLCALINQREMTAVFLGSADLTHYGRNYDFSPKGTGIEAVEWVRNVNDKSLIDKALAMNALGVLDDSRELHNTCSPGPIISAMTCASIHESKGGFLIDYFTSYDVMPGSSFVGYAAIVY
ncbi:MAG: AmmeMemoRadiSam system protein B [Syntrophaceae bacterium]|nr:AmmeMemoRadiSam system protein B [Syntrophaceae bacterium]